jgi:ethanolamine ammonia-lyase small subunit
MSIAGNPARLGVGRAGPRYTTPSMLKLRADHARAVDSVLTEVPADWPKRNGLREFASEAASREQYLLNPDLGRRIRPGDIAQIRKLKPGREHRNWPSVLVFIGDGLSSIAIEKNVPPLLPRLFPFLTKRYRVFPPFFVRNARVRIEDHIGEILRPDVVCMLVGERPGLTTAESLSAYVIYRPRLKSIEADRTVISNIHRGGLSIPDAAREIAALIDNAIKYRETGTRLAQLRDEAAE